MLQYLIRWKRKSQRIKKIRLKRHLRRRRNDTFGLPIYWVDIALEREEFTWILKRS